MSVDQNNSCTVMTPTTVVCTWLNSPGSLLLPQVTPTPAPFQWNGQNYLMKMLHDCDFLDRVDALRNWLGFSVSGNPFFCPQQSRTRVDRDSESTNQASSNGDVEFDTIGLANIGRQPWLGPLEFEIVEDGEDADKSKDARPKKRRLRKACADRTAAPYAAAVVNDLTLLPPVRESSPTRSRGYKTAGLTGGPDGDAVGSSPRKVNVGIESLVPNLVSREDARRISVARQALSEEQQRVLAAARASEVADGEGDSRRRSRAPSTVLESALGSSRRDSRASPTPTIVSPSKRRISRFGHPSARQNGSTVGGYSPDSQKACASGSPETGFMSSIVLATAGLLEKPTPEPHPGLGPVLLQSDRPGGELHPNPFLHTVTEAHETKTDLLEQPIVIRTVIRTPTVNTRDRCLTDPTATPSPSISSEILPDCQEFTAPLRSLAGHHRPATAPATILTKLGDGPASSEGRKRSFRASQQRRRSRRSASRASCAEAAIPQVEEGGQQADLEYSSRGLRLSRKAGAELRALTAAGTSGRRQPPPREMRLRRLARDVARHSAELQRLVREEDQLRKSLACCSGGRATRRGDEASGRVSSRGRGVNAEAWEESDGAVAAMVAVRNDDGAAGEGGICVGQVAAPSPGLGSGLGLGVGPAPERIEAVLEAKRREIELKTFDLGIRRDELRCLRIVQKQERERKLALEMERRRVDLDEGQVRTETSQKIRFFSRWPGCFTGCARSRMNRFFFGLRRVLAHGPLYCCRSSHLWLRKLQRLPEDDAVAETLEDSSCLLIQKRIRGNAGRKYAAWYKRKVNEVRHIIKRAMSRVNGLLEGYGVLAFMFPPPPQPLLRLAARTPAHAAGNATKALG